MQINIMKHKKWYLIFSACLLAPGIISLALFGLRLSIDFIGGSVFEFDFGQNVSKSETQLRKTFSDQRIQIESIIYSGSKAIIRTKPVEVSKNEKLKAEIGKSFKNSKQISFETIGPSVGKETARKALIALVTASFGIVLYIAYAFRNIPKPYSSFRFGISAIIAMLHDAFVVIGIFSFLGKFFNVEVNVLFITAVLTVIGFSVHDTIVVFDRIRENLGKFPKTIGFSDVVNFSVVETLNRSFATSLTVIIVLTSLLLLGGSTIKDFILALVIGIISGTFSSIFTASPILVYWEEYINFKGR